MSENIIEAGEGKLLFIQLAEAMTPTFKENNRRKWIMAGEKDNYPDYLLELFNKSAKHASIIRSKVHYTVGAGWKTEDEKETPFVKGVNDDEESLAAVTSKCALDLEIHGGFYLEVVWNKNGKCQIRHADYRKYRSNKDNTLFYYKEDGDWTHIKKQPIEISAFDPEKKRGRQIFYFKEYRPGIDTYTLPSYIAGNNFIEADIEVSKHTLNNAKTGFTPSKLITLPNGDPTDEQKRIIERKFQSKFTGSDGLKFLLSFVNTPDKKPIVEDLGVSDLSKEDFTAVDNLIQQNIFVSHQVTSPMLFGIRVAGQLGGRDELIEAFELFKNTYINYRQAQLEEVFNFFATINGSQKLKLMPVSPISFQFGETIMSQNMTTAEIRETMGLPELDKSSIDDQFQEILEVLKIINPRVGERIVASLTDDEVRAMVGLKPKPQDQQQPEQPQQFSNENYDWFSEYGVSREKFRLINSHPIKFSSQKDCLEYELQFAEASILSPSEQLIIDYIKQDPKITPEIISKKSGLLVEKVNDILKSLENRNLLTVSSEPTGIGDKTVISRTPSDLIPKEPYTREIGIKYSYELRPDAPPLKPGGHSRPFCQKLMDMNRLYTRRDIENMSLRLGYDVWTHKGGWYHNPETGENQDECRHTWFSHQTVTI